MGSPVKAVLDTNILIDYLNGAPQSEKEIERYREPLISVITWMEVMAGAKGTPVELLTRGFLQQFRIEPISMEIAEEAVALRAARKLKLPDAVVLATARVNRCRLVTRNTKDFPASDPTVRVPYRL